MSLKQTEIWYSKRDNTAGTVCESEATLSITVARCCVQDRDWKSSIHSREDTEWGSMCWMVLGDVAIPKMNISGRRSM